MAEYEGSTSALIADVDCTADGEELCTEVGVEGYPTIKWGVPGNLQDYEGEREYDDLKKFADENLGPQCSPSNIDLCDAAQKALIDKYRAMDKDSLVEQVSKIEGEIKQVSADFDKAIEKLQEEYEALEKAKEAKVKSLKNSNLGLMKSVIKQKYPDAKINLLSDKDMEGDGEGDGEGDMEGDMEGDGEGDEELDAMQAEADAMGDGEGDAEGEAEGDAEGEAEGKAEGDAEIDAKSEL